MKYAKNPELVAVKVQLKERHQEEKYLRKVVKEVQQVWDSERALIADLVIARCGPAAQYAKAHPQYADLDAAETRRAANLGVVFTPNLSRLEILERDSNICDICGERIDLDAPYPSPEAIHFEHIVPMDKGGPHVADNMRLIHFGCGSKLRIRIALQAKESRRLAAILSS